MTEVKGQLRQRANEVPCRAITLPAGGAALTFAEGFGPRLKDPPHGSLRGKLSSVPSINRTAGESGATVVQRVI